MHAPPANRFVLRKRWCEKGPCFLEQSLQAVLLQRFGKARKKHGKFSHLKKKQNTQLLCKQQKV